MATKEELDEFNAYMREHWGPEFKEYYDRMSSAGPEARPSLLEWAMKRLAAIDDEELFAPRCPCSTPSRDD